MEKDDEKNEISLYEMCLNVISYKFDSIDSVIIKDLPKHILEQILLKLNPLDLEKLENEEFLHLRGISTDLLWKDHIIRYGAKVSNFNSWRTQFFQKKFHAHIYCLADASKRNMDIENIQDYTNDELNLSIKHLSRIRVQHNTCVYLAQHHDLLTKLAPVVCHLETELLRDQSVESLTCILDVLLKNKLQSFLLSNCKVENKDKLRALLKALTKSQSLDQTCLTTLSVIKELPVKMIKHDDKDDVNAVNKQENTCTLFLDNDLITVCQGEEERYADNSFLGDEDELYEDIFSKRTELQEMPPESSASKNRIYCSVCRREPWGKEQIPLLVSNQIHSNCLTELKLFSCLMNDTSVKIFSEELTFFRSLRSLVLCEVGLFSFPSMNCLICSIKELAIHGSLRHLVFENEYLTIKHLGMFYDMLMLSCERCQPTNICKGLSCLRLVGGVVLNMDRLGAKLRTCSFCEEPVFACRTTAGIWFKTEDNTFYSACKCLNRGVLECCDTIDFHLPRKSSVVSTLDEKDIVKEVGRDFHAQSGSSENNIAERAPVFSNHQYITCGIESLNFSFRNTKLECATVLASSLLRNRSLRKISLPSCRLTMQDISNIFDCISGCDFHDANTVIEKLDLRSNLFQLAFHTTSLCNLIARSHLVYLDLSYCGLEVIPDEVVLALSSNKFLQVLMVAGNRLGDAGVMQLSQVFTSAKKTSVLNTLGLSCNRLSSCSLLHLASVLKTWPIKLHEISVCKNPLVKSTIVRESLQEVFNVVIIEPYVDGAVAYADYLSEM